MIRNAVTMLMILFVVSAGQPVAAEMPVMAGLQAPMDGNLKYPFVKEASVDCGHWSKRSQDYPYFGAPRNNGKRSHAGVDLYPTGGSGTLVKAIKSGSVVKIAPFYIRGSGEVTYGVLVDHGDFSANYAELTMPEVTVSSYLKKGQIIGRVSGTGQLHFELYSAGSTDWVRGWYGRRPDNLLDPTVMMLNLFH